MLSPHLTSLRIRIGLLVRWGEYPSQLSTPLDAFIVSFCAPSAPYVSELVRSIFYSYGRGGV